MKKRTVVAGLLAVAALMWGSAASAQPVASPDVAPAPAVREFEGVRYVTGGVGEGERAGILGMAQDFNLKLTFAQQSGNYLSDVMVAVTGRDGRKVLELQSDGPLVLAKLPPGDYRISATANGREQTRNTRVAATGQQSLNFYW